MPTISLPSVTLNFATERLPGAEPELEGEDFSVAFPPRLEKFHLPSAVFRSVICGCSSVISVTRISLEVMSGMTSTPTLRDFAVTNGVLPNAGSSAMEMLSAETLPVRIDRLRFPTLTSLPSASLAVASILGRKLFTLMKKGIATRITTSIAMTMPTILRMRFIDSLPSERTVRLRWKDPRKKHGPEQRLCGLRVYQKTMRYYRLS